MRITHVLSALLRSLKRPQTFQVILNVKAFSLVLIITRLWERKLNIPWSNAISPFLKSTREQEEESWDTWSEDWFHEHTGSAGRSADSSESGHALDLGVFPDPAVSPSSSSQLSQELGPNRTPEQVT